jgi:hypothetical protein
VVRKITDDEFVKVWNEIGSPVKISEHFGVAVRNIYDRRRTIENKRGIRLLTKDGRLTLPENRKRATLDIEGYVIVFSDAHFMPGEPSVGFNALLKLIKTLKPKAIIANGDILDGGTISRFGPMDWTPVVNLKDELEAVQWHMDKIVKACKGLGTYLHRTLGNHDIRFDRKLAGAVPEFRGIQGTTLKDHIPEWSVSWSVMVNDICMIKHRLQHSGIHSGYNNTLKAGVSTVSGHTHLLEVKGWGDYQGRRYGVSTGMLADPDGEQFNYLEDNPTPWCSGFAVLKFYDGLLLPPELVEVIDGTAYFRGEVVAS